MRADVITPVFIFAVSRSGSTLLQRVLAAHKQVATANEPWILLAPFYAVRPRGIFAEYDHPSLARAVNDFCAVLPRGRADYDDAVRAFATHLYERAAHSECWDEAAPRYFVDKTPPYFFIVDDVLRTFPDAKCIFLWRNPLGIAASLIAWPEGSWGQGLYRENLFTGLVNLVRAYEANRERVHSVRFEDLVLHSEVALRDLMSYLDLPPDSGLLSEFAAVRLRGSMGDQAGTRAYSALSHAPVEKWRTTLANPLRRTAAKRYLLWLGRSRLAAMGYDLDELLGELSRLPRSRDRLIADVGHLGCALVTEPIWRRVRGGTNVGGPSSLRYVLGSPDPER